MAKRDKFFREIRRERESNYKKEKDIGEEMKEKKKKQEKENEKRPGGN